MTIELSHHGVLSDGQLLLEVRRLASQERQATARLIAALGELDAHHVVPFAEGGATSAENLELRCRTHNAYEAERWFGAREEDLVRERGGAWA